MKTNNNIVLGLKSHRKKNYKVFLLATTLRQHDETPIHIEKMIDIVIWLKVYEIWKHFNKKKNNYNWTVISNKKLIFIESNS